MEYLDDLIILLIFLAPLLRRLFEKKKGPSGTGMPRPDASAEDDGQRLEEDPLAEALRQIRDALGEGEPEPMPAPVPERTAQKAPDPSRPTALERATERQPRPLEQADAEFHELGAYDHEEHGFGRSNPLSEELFEQQPAYARSKRPAPRTPTPAPDLSRPLKVVEVADKKADSSHRIADELRERGSARDAFVFAEVFGPPRSRRPVRDRRF